MSKLVLNDIASGFQSNTAANTNNTLIETALENTLSRDGTSPNQMGANIDMNTYSVINLGAPANATAAARLQDISDSDATGAASAILRAELLLASDTTGGQIVGFKQSGTGAVISRKIQDKLRETISIKDFGAIGDGVTDDTAAITSFFTASSGKYCFLPPGSYKVTSLLTHALTNCSFVGVPGQTIITGDFGRSILKLLDISNVHFYGIKFVSTFVTAVASEPCGVVLQNENSIYNSSFINCSFSAPNAETQGLGIYTNSVVTSVNTIDGLTIQDCLFEDIGRMAIIIMNRHTTDPVVAPTLVKRVTINGNKGKNLGLGGAYGFFLTLDGFGSNFQVCFNTMENCFGIGIENTGWVDGKITDNSFSDFSRSWKPLALGGNLSNAWITNNYIARNRTVEAANASSYLVKVKHSVIEDNFFWSSVGDQPILVRGCQHNRFQKNYWKNTATATARYGILYEDPGADGCYGNLSYDEIFDTASGTGNTSALRYYGAATVTRNIAYRPIFLRTTGAYCDESTGAINNLIVNATDGLTGLWDLDYFTENFTSDADMTMLLPYYSSAIVRITNGSLTIGRNVIMPSIRKEYTVINATAQTLTFKAATGTGIAIATGKTAKLFWNGTNMIRLTADV